KVQLTGSTIFPEDWAGEIETPGEFEERAAIAPYTLCHGTEPVVSSAAMSSQNYSITSSAVASRVGGTLKPSILAGPAVMTNSNLFGCTTGKSAALAPLRMRPV